MDSTKNKTNETFKMNGNWDQQSKGLKEKYSQLTDSDLKFEAGKEDEMLNRVGSRLGKNRQEVEGIIRSGQDGKNSQDQSTDQPQQKGTPK